ncbi:hypothetical protein [Marinilabilia salmonicolor]|uniref:Lipoprotein n=1 Tax=Marinilabilia salmonicolor TaxID=989 RepID=A0A368VDQ9_9BACT|nr:hypothetical protein [Marinilabilia salmonicolor]RCW38853.1 hypothetical protein DFO77_1027 [Marinilabilia salmonicolor]
MILKSAISKRYFIIPKWDLKKFLLLFFLSLISCDLTNKIEKEDEKYIAKGNFGELEISKTKLDSIISFLPFWRLSDFKSIEPKQINAVQILKKYIEKNNQNNEHFLIVEIIEEEDSKLTFYLDHIDTFVYWYHIERDNAIPVTGNPTGINGYYTVDLKTDSVSVSYLQ